ncbi:sensor histidine kinase [Kribbella monticola]|uniref:hypothetical protein n=1 Tax=Kribbella monticola TaxID=2185285 RepID=UPI00130048ED|nr:hypothetical protein [Kribbella monticola]
MAIVLELRRPRNAVRPAGGITYGAVTPYRAEGRVAYPDRLVRFIALAPLLASTLIAVVQLSNLTGSPTRILIDVALSLCLMAPHLQHLWALAHAERPRAGGWTLAVVLVAYLAGLPLAGIAWPLMGVQVLVSLAIVLPRSWSVAAGGGLVIGILIVTQVFYPGTNPLWITVVILDRSGACLVLAWFSAALRQLLAARADLATQAVLRERLRIDAELAETVGTALRAIEARGVVAGRLVDAESTAAAQVLGALVDGSRRTLAETRRMIRAYQRGSLGAELDTAVALLNAAGITTHLVLPGGEVTESADGEFAKALRATVDRLLHDGSVRSCRLTVVRSGSGLRLLSAVDGSTEAGLA